MRSTVVISSLALVLGLAVSTAAYGAPCAGFNDVSDTSQFCPNVEWLKNRSITLGCTSTTAYCPDDPVTRLSMAAFMNRLGTALEPRFDYMNGFGIGTSFAVLQYLCPTNAYTPVGFRRWATIEGRLNFHAFANLSVVSKLYYSTDNGTTWIPAGGFFVSQSADTGKRATVVPLAPALALEPGTSYRFAISASLIPPGSPGTVDWYCETRVRIDNRNGATSPFDN